MPVKVNKRIWKRARVQARKQGHQANYAYIMTIYKRMSSEKGLLKSYVIPPEFSIVRQPQGHIDPRALALQREALTQPQPATIARKLDDKRPLLVASEIVRGLGLNAVEQDEWITFVHSIESTPNELVFRRFVMQKAMESELDGIQRKLILERALGYWRKQKSKSELGKSQTIFCIKQGVDNG